MSFSPSNCNKGLLEDPHCPIPLGSGFGPPVYRMLFQEWIRISNQSSFTVDEVNGVQLLLSRMLVCTRDTMREEVLSGVIASTYQIILPRFNKGGDAALCFEHELSVPHKSGSSVDVAITNALDAGHKGLPCIHTILEVKWEFSAKEFPEMQATASARLFQNAQSLRCHWVPIFVLSRTHVAFGVAFRFYGTRWAYSEIHAYRKATLFLPSVPKDLLFLCRFSRFMIFAAEYHRNFVKTADLNVNDQHVLVDLGGTPIFNSLSRIMGDRVVCGQTGDEAKTVVKFYRDRESAEKAVAKQIQIESALGILTTAAILDGIGGGVCAVKDTLIDATDKVTKNHLKALTGIVSTLHASRLVHGDLRLQNIIFGNNSKVTLIDFEWSGLHTEAKFPINVNVKAFGDKATPYVYPESEINMDFDWFCLADILAYTGDQSLVEAAEKLNQAGVLAGLDSLPIGEDDHVLSKLIFTPKQHTHVNFGCFNSRISDYYNLEESSEPTPNQQSHKRKRDPSPVASGSRLT
jgi:hypothetical protein